MTEVGASIVASSMMVVAIISGGRLLDSIAPSNLADGAYQTSMACLERPLMPVRDTLVRSFIQLCLTDGGIRPIVELADAVPGSVYTAWLALLEQPAAWEGGPCAGARLASSTGIAAPGRVDGAIADQDGRVLLSHSFPGLRLDANIGVELLVAEHGSSLLTRGATEVGELITWNRAWSGLRGPLPDRGQGQLIGCAAFWIRGGAEQAEH